MSERNLALVTGASVRDFSPRREPFVEARQTQPAAHQVRQSAATTAALMP